MAAVTRHCVVGVAGGGVPSTACNRAMHAAAVPCLDDLDRSNVLCSHTYSHRTHALESAANPHAYANRAVSVNVRSVAVVECRVVGVGGRVTIGCMRALTGGISWTLRRAAVDETGRPADEHAHDNHHDDYDGYGVGTLLAVVVSAAAVRVWIRRSAWENVCRLVAIVGLGGITRRGDGTGRRSGTGSVSGNT